MLDPNNLPEVEGTELLARYVVYSNHFRSDLTPKPDLFIPHLHQELAVTCHRNATTAEIWGAGLQVATQR